MSIQNNFPAIKPTLNLDFANTEALDPRITFARASTATYYGTQTAKAEENLLLQSQDFTTTWSSGNSTKTANTSTAPDGTETADTIAEDDRSTFRRIDQTVSASGIVTISVFAKLGAGSRYLVIGVSNGVTDTASATFDLSLGTNTQTQANGAYSSSSATITAVAESFYRCTLTVTTTTVTRASVGFTDTSTPSTSNRGFGADYTGDNTSTIILWGAQLEQRSAVTAYTPTTTQPITNYIPVLQTAASGVARFDHDPVTGESLGLLIEEQRTNLVTYSEDFSDSAWGKVASSITSNTIVAPDGTLTGDVIVATTQNAQHRLDQIPTSSAGSQVLSLYAKSSGYDFLGLRIGSAGTSFNLLTGTVSTNSTGSVGEIQSVGNGWYRCSIVVANASANDAVRINITDAVSPSTSFTGDGYSGIYIWGAQLEAGAFPTSYIKTEGSQVTRSADATSMTGANFSSWFNNAEGAVYLDYKTSGQTTLLRVASVSDGTGSNKMDFAIASAGGIGPYLFVVANGTNQVTTGAGTYTSNTNYKWASAYEINNYAWSKDGGSVVSDTDALVPVVNQLRIAQDGSGGNPFNGTIRKLAYYPKRLTNAELQGLTS